MVAGGQPALLLAYVTDIPITDVDALADEAAEVWPLFQPLVVQGKYVYAYLSPTEEPSGSMIQTYRSYNIGYAMNADGTWSRRPLKRH